MIPDNEKLLFRRFPRRRIVNKKIQYKNVWEALSNNFVRHFQTSKVDDIKGENLSKGNTDGS